MSARTALRRWLDGRHYSRHLSRHELEWAADYLDEPDGDDWADTLHGIKLNLAAEFAAVVCAPGCQGEEHRTALLPLPAEPDWSWQPRRTTQTVNLPPWDVPDAALEVMPHDPVQRRSPATSTGLHVDLPGPANSASRTGGAVRAGESRPRRRRRPWSGLFGGPNPQNLPGPDDSSDPGSRAGEFLEGEIVPAPPSDQPVITVNIHATPQLKADLARIDADTLAILARIDAAIARERDALHAWSRPQLELERAS